MKDIFSEARNQGTRESEKRLMDQLIAFTTSIEHIKQRLDILEKGLTYLLSKDEDFIRDNNIEEKIQEVVDETKD